MKIKSMLLIALLFPLLTSAKDVTKSDWIKAMSTALPTALCNSKQYFRQCFKVTVQECEETAASATRICLNKYKKDIPNTLTQPKDGSHWGGIMGACAGEAYEITLIKKRISNAKCNNVKNWI